MITILEHKKKGTGQIELGLCPKFYLTAFKACVIALSC